MDTSVRGASRVQYVKKNRVFLTVGYHNSHLNGKGFQ